MIYQVDLWVKPGDNMHYFEGANDAIGTSILKFDSKEKLIRILTDQKTWLKAQVK